MRVSFLTVKIVRLGTFQDCLCFSEKNEVLRGKRLIYFCFLSVFSGRVGWKQSTATITHSRLSSRLSNNNKKIHQQHSLHSSCKKDITKKKREKMLHSKLCKHMQCERDITFKTPHPRKRPVDYLDDVDGNILRGRCKFLTAERRVFCGNRYALSVPGWPPGWCTTPAHLLFKQTNKQSEKRKISTTRNSSYNFFGNRHIYQRDVGVFFCLFEEQQRWCFFLS